jgi:DNA-directed RNA polymerase subunit omega
MPLDNITELKKRVPGGKYALTRALAERARQLQNGALPLTEVKAPNPLSVAIDEIVQGKITFRVTEEEEAPTPAPEEITQRAVKATKGAPAAPQVSEEGAAAMAPGADKAAAENALVGDRAQGSGAPEAANAFGTTADTATQA